MSQVAELDYYRQRAIELLKEHLPSDHLDTVDFYLDEYLRDVLDLPDRPENDLPYVGWISPPNTPSDNERRTSERGITLIKSHEGLRLKAYHCPANVLTIGYGHTKNVYPSMVITSQKAEELLKQDLSVYESAVNKYVTVPLNQNQFDALVSFSFNVGTNALGRSTLLRKLNSKDYQGAGNEFMRWVRAGTRILPGLVRRRQEEKELFLS